MEAKPSLTIAIPTYNRPKYLAETLRQLLPQVTDDWVLHIHDNCSDQPVAEVLADLLASFGPERVVIFRNKANVGGNANILRCFENCSTEWIVVLGDDDRIEPNLVKDVLEAKTQNPDIVYANFSSTIFQRESDFTTTGLSEFCEKLDNWSNLLFLPCGLYKTSAVVPYLQYGYQYSYAMGPHVAMLLQCLNDSQGKCFFSNKNIVENCIPADVTTWVRFNGNMMPLLTEIIPDRTSQQAFFNRLKDYFMSPMTLAAALVERAASGGGDQRLLFEIRSLCYQCMGTKLKDALMLPLMRMLVTYPSIGMAVLKISRKLRGLESERKVTKDIL